MSRGATRGAGLRAFLWNITQKATFTQRAVIGPFANFTTNSVLQATDISHATATKTVRCNTSLPVLGH